MGEHIFPELLDDLVGRTLSVEQGEEQMIDADGPIRLEQFD